MLYDFIKCLFFLFIVFLVCVEQAIFEKTVEAFKRLADESGFFYEKAVSIVDNVARVRSCLMMLDLECDVAVVEMFHQFLKVIR